LYFSIKPPGITGGFFRAAFFVPYSRIAPHEKNGGPTDHPPGKPITREAFQADRLVVRRAQKNPDID
jgi:hypothetical protein